MFQYSVRVPKVEITAWGYSVGHRPFQSDSGSLIISQRNLQTSAAVAADSATVGRAAAGKTIPNFQNCQHFSNVRRFAKF
jgi:hypothetical protein